MNRIMNPRGSLQYDLDALFNGFFKEWPVADRAAAFPLLNVWEDEHHFLVEAELPGLRMEDLEVTVLGEELMLKGERKDPERNGAAYHRRERGSGSFVRSISMPAAVDGEHVTASLHDGVLSISLPKAKEARPLKIQVKGLDK